MSAGGASRARRTDKRRWVGAAKTSTHPVAVLHSKLLVPALGVQPAAFEYDVEWCQPTEPCTGSSGTWSRTWVHEKCISPECLASFQERSHETREERFPIPLAFVVGATTDSTEEFGIPVHSSWTATVERGGHPSHPEYSGAQLLTTLLRQRKRKWDETTSPPHAAATAPASKRHNRDEVRSLPGCTSLSSLIVCCLLSVVMMHVCATPGP